MMWKEIVKSTRGQIGSREECEELTRKAGAIGGVEDDKMGVEL